MKHSIYFTNLISDFKLIGSFFQQVLNNFKNFDIHLCMSAQTVLNLSILAEVINTVLKLSIIIIIQYMIVILIIIESWGTYNVLLVFAVRCDDVMNYIWLP